MTGAQSGRIRSFSQADCEVVYFANAKLETGIDRRDGRDQRRLLAGGCRLELAPVVGKH
jgi:hypothetical protein